MNPCEKGPGRKDARRSMDCQRNGGWVETKALIAMSGGVDSAVAALLTAREGNTCLGCTLRLYDGPEAPGGQRSCCTLEDAEDARAVAYRLGMPYYVWNFTEAFRSGVMEPFADCYQRGETPNPCIECNRLLKFGKLLDRAEELGCDCLVTGHYARIIREDGRYLLKKGLDPEKDQSYVLYMLSQDQLARLRFPLGTLRKPEVRQLAEANGFLNARKPDSQDICFVPDGDYAAAIERLTGHRAEPGNFVDRSGRVLGQHRGIIRYTVGQHRGLGLGWHEPLYVLRLDKARNEVVLGPEAALYTRTVRVPAFHWIAGAPPAGAKRCTAKLRYRQREQSALAEPLPDGGVLLRFDAPQRAPAPGQSAVLYDADTVLGGGIIAAEAQGGTEAEGATAGGLPPGEPLAGGGAAAGGFPPGGPLAGGLPPGNHRQTARR